MPDFAKILLAVAPHGKASIRAGFAAAFPDCIDRADLVTTLRVAHFIAQCAHESAGLATTTEYASGREYEGRKDLGNVQKGDGPRFKGRGLIQLTGRANYARFGKALGVNLIETPALAAVFPEAALVAAEYWHERGLNKWADSDDIGGVTLRVNGGYNGLASRKAYLAKAKAALSDLKGALTSAATEEKNKAIAKVNGAVSAVIPGVVAPASVVNPSVETHAALGLGGEIALIALGAVLLVGAVWIFIQSKKHADAASALSNAAKEITP